MTTFHISLLKIILKSLIFRQSEHSELRIIKSVQTIENLMMGQISAKKLKIQFWILQEPYFVFYSSAAYIWMRLIFECGLYSIALIFKCSLCSNGLLFKCGLYSSAVYVQMGLYSNAAYIQIFECGVYSSYQPLSAFCFLAQNCPILKFPIVWMDLIIWRSLRSLWRIMRHFRRVFHK